MEQVTNYLSTAEAARVLGLSQYTLEAWRTRGGGPRYRKFGKAVRYHRADLERFAEASARDSTSTAVAA